MSKIKKYTPDQYDTGDLNLLTMEKKLIIRVSKLMRHKRDLTAKVLGISERNLYFKIDRHDIGHLTTFNPKNKNN